MTTLLLVRHATSALTDNVLLGRVVDAPLDEHGRAQCRRLARHFSARQTCRVESSPRLRTRQTAEAIARALSIEPCMDAALDEIDFGAWSGRSFAELEDDPDWRRWNERRGSARTPAGDTVAAVQARIIGYLRSRRDAAETAVVTHAEPIRIAVMACLGLPPEAYAQVEISPASITTFTLDGQGLHVQRINERIGEPAT